MTIRPASHGWAQGSEHLAWGGGRSEGKRCCRSPVDTRRKAGHGIHSGDEKRGIRKRARRKEEEERLERQGHKDRRGGE